MLKRASQAREKRPPLKYAASYGARSEHSRTRSPPRRARAASGDGPTLDRAGIARGGRARQRTRRHRRPGPS